MGSVVVAFLVPVAWALGAGGAAAGTKGVNDLRIASNQQLEAAAKHAAAVEAFESDSQRTRSRVAAYGDFQRLTVERTFDRFAAWFERNDKKVKQLDRSVVDGVEIQLAELKMQRFAVMSASNLLKSGAAAVVSGVVTRQAVLTGVGVLASASTGTAISTLGGAAATNATMAWLGGGSLAAGGGGVAAGATVLSAVTMAPAVAITGLTLIVQGQKALTKAAEFQAEVDIAVAAIHSASSALESVHARMDELSEILRQLTVRLTQRLDDLDAVDFDPDLHAELLLAATQLLRSIAEVLTVPVFDDDGGLTDVSFTVVQKYSDARKDREHIVDADHSGR